MIGQTVSHYKILELLGEGGMGVVYRAVDTRLDRTVAIKFLPLELTRDPVAKKRFIQEARAASALDHPNICTVHDIDETDKGRLFMVMACYPGPTLKTKLETGPLDLEEAVNIAIQIARGLTRAHQRSIIHRDIKPANILFTGDSDIKIADFGLAKLAGRAGPTRSGSIVGTAAYMSPEQIRGEAVDLRTDLWALGVVLYEMVTGRRPFQGEHEQSILYSILNQEPEPAASSVRNLPADFDRIIGRCLDKDPARRYRSANELIADLELIKLELKGFRTSAGQPFRPAKRHPASRIIGLIAVLIIFIVVVYNQFSKLNSPGPGPPPEHMKKLAVLFFDNLGPPEDEFFADGITDAITARLAAIRGLGVISRQSTIQYKDSRESLRAIGEQLGVDYILEGTVQRESPTDPAGSVRIIPQLIYVPEDIHLWADTYDESMTKVFEVQSIIAERVALAMNVTILQSERDLVTADPTRNLEAYEYFLRGGDHYSRRLSAAEALSAERMYQKSVDLDPAFTAAWAALSRARIWIYNLLGDKELKTKAEIAVNRALELDPDLVDGHLALGFYYYYGTREYDRALEQFELARDKAPGQAEIIEAIAFIRRRQGQWETSAALLEKAQELDPRNFNLYLDLGINYFFLRQFDKSESCFDRCLSLSTAVASPYLYKIRVCLGRDGTIDKARQVLEEAAGRFPPEYLINIPQLVGIRIFPDIYSGLLAELNTAELGAEMDTASYYLVVAELKHRLGEEDRALAYYDSARVNLETPTSRGGTHPIFRRSCLGLAYAGLGLRDKAVREAQAAVSLLPVSDDALEGLFFVEILAEVYAKVGDKEAAIDELERILTVPSQISVGLLRLDPVWDPLRSHPRFKKLLAAGR